MASLGPRTFGYASLKTLQSLNSVLGQTGMSNQDRTDKLLRTYLEVLNEFNESAFAITGKFKEHPKPSQLCEIETIAKYLPDGGTLIDVGTGTGIVPQVFHRLGHRVIGIDQGSPSRASLERIKALGVEGYFAEVGVETVPLPDEAADIVFAGDIIEHLPDSPRPFIKEVWRLLKTGGWFILTTPNAVRLTVRLKLLMGYSNWTPLEEIYDQERNYCHHKEYVAEELLELMKRIGFDAITLKFIEGTLNTPQIARSFSDIKTINRFKLEIDRDNKFNPFSMMEYLRVLALIIVTVVPYLRSSMICYGRKSVSKSLAFYEVA